MASGDVSVSGQFHGHSALKLRVLPVGKSTITKGQIGNSGRWQMAREFRLGSWVSRMASGLFFSFLLFNILRDLCDSFGPGF